MKNFKILSIIIMLLLSSVGVSLTQGEIAQIPNKTVCNESVLKPINISSDSINDNFGYNSLDEEDINEILAKYTTMSNPLGNPNPEYASPKPEPIDVPSKFSWKNLNGEDWTTPAKNQGACGSCWAFGALSALESMINIGEENPNLDVDLSEQYILSCLPSAGGCDGGHPFYAFYYIKDDSAQGNYHNGTILESCFPYGADDSVSCSEKCQNWLDNLVPISEYGYWEPDGSEIDRQRIKTQIFELGPVAVGLNAIDDFKMWGDNCHDPEQYYSYPESGSGTNHCVELVGWKDNESIANGGYWICKNSWGTDWGYEGFFNIEYGCLNIDSSSSSITFVDYQNGSFNRSPIAVVDGPYYISVGETVPFSADGSYDPDGEIVLYQWDCDGDGIFETNSITQTAAFQYLSVGNFTVNLRVKDNDGLIGTNSTYVLVNASEGNNPPSKPFSPSPDNDETNVSADFVELSWNCTEPDADPMTFDVYLGLSADSMELKSQKQSDFSYLLSSLEHSTKYYWKVIAYDHEGLSNSSDVWSFTTGTALDTTPPNVNIQIKSPTLIHDEYGLMIDDQTSIQFNCTDIGLGLDYLHFKIYKKSNLSDPYVLFSEDDHYFDTPIDSLLSRIRLLLDNMHFYCPSNNPLSPLDDASDYKYHEITLSQISEIESAWYQIHCYAVDKAANQGSEAIKNVTLDMDAPASSTEIIGYFVEKNGVYWVTENVSFDVHSSDKDTPVGVGMNYSEWSINKLDAQIMKNGTVSDGDPDDMDSENNSVQFNISCQGLPDNPYHVFFHGVDKFGNAENEWKYPIVVDNKDPVCHGPIIMGLNASGNSSNSTHVLPSTMIKIYATDLGGVGVDFLYYELWKDGQRIDYGQEVFDEFTFTFGNYEGNGRYTLKWYAMDLLMNRCDWSEHTFIVDDQLPLIAISVNGNSVKGENTDPDWWITSNSEVVIEVSGLGESPDQSAKYRTNNGEWEDLTQSPMNLYFSEEGRVELQVKVTDGLNPTINTTVFFVDNTAPEMTIMEPRTGHGIFYKNNSRLSSAISSLDVVNPDPNCEEVGIHDGHPGNAVLIDVMDGFDTFCLKSGCFEYDGDEQLFTGSFIITDGLTVGDGEFLYVPFVSDELYNYNDIRFELEQIYNNSGGNVAQFKSQILPYVDSHRVEWLYMDNTPPTITIETPDSESQIFGNSFEMNVNVFDVLSGVPAGSSVYITLDGLEIGVLSVSSDNDFASGSLLIPATMQTSHDVELKATVYDDAGNSASDTIVIDVIRDAQTPVVEILSPSNGSQVTDSFEVSVHAMDVDTTVQNLSVQLEINPSTASSWSIDLSYDSGYFVGLVNISSLLNATTIELTASASDESNNTGVSDTVEIIVFSDVENRPPHAPSSPIPSDDALNVSLDVLLQWSCSDADGDAITYDCYLGNSSGSLALVEQNVSSKSFLPSNLHHNNTYYWKVVAWDENNAQNQSPIWSFSTSKVNQPPRTPSSPNPSNSSESRLVDSTVLSWSCSDPDKDQLTYAVFFGKNQNPMLKNNSLRSKSFDPGVLEYNTTYYWRINVSDDNGHYVEGPLWQFTTDLEEDGYLWADAGGPYTGFVGDTLEFDASSSTTENGTSITGYKWDFDGDMIYDPEWSNTSTTSHSYSIAGTYTVFVKIKNNLGDLAVDQSSVVISEESNVVLSNPPSKPIVTGPTRGRSNTVYQFNVTATDPDGDTIKIQASWGSMGDNTESQSFSSGQTITLTHSFSATKVYTLSFKAIDENGVVSQSTIYNIEINTIVLDGYGDLLDYDGDGVFDKFKPSGQAMSLQTEVGREDGMIGFDVDGDEEFDYIYDSSNDVVSEWKKDSPAAGGLRLPIPLWLIALIAAVIVVAVVLFFFSGQIKEKLSSTNKKPSKRKTNNGQQQINLPTQSNSGGGSGFKRL